MLTNIPTAAAGFAAGFGAGFVARETSIHGSRVVKNLSKALIKTGIVARDKARELPMPHWSWSRSEPEEHAAEAKPRKERTTAVVVAKATKHRGPRSEAAAGAKKARGKKSHAKKTTAKKARHA